MSVAQRMTSAPINTRSLTRLVTSHSRGRLRRSLSPAPSYQPAVRLGARPRASVSASAPKPAAQRWHGTAHCPEAVKEVTPMPEFEKEDTYQIVIIGGGPAGLALACNLLSKPGLSDKKILLIEGGSLDRVRNWSGKEDWDNRVSSLTAENVAFLKEIGAWDHVAPERSCPVHDMIVWTSTSPTSNSQIHFPELGSPMAHMTENVNLQRALLRRIDELSNGRLTILEGSRVQEMRLGEGSRWVGLNVGSPETPRWVRGSVVAGADGPNSPVRAFSKIESFGHAYNTHAVVATLHHEPARNNTAFQRFLNTGPIAFLPLSVDASTLVWSTSPELAAAYKKLPTELLTKLVNLGFYHSEAELREINLRILAGAPTEELSVLIAAAMDKALLSLSTEDVRNLPPVTTSISPKSVAGFPLRLSHAESYIGERTVLVGDAAHTCHPLGGQGLNMGLADVQSLGRVWEKAAQNGGDFGAYTAMLPYSKERYPANHLLLSTTDKFHHIFRNRIPLVNWARSMGMDIINELGPVKQALMENAGARAPGKVDRQGKARAGSWYESAAGGFENWQQAKGIAGMALGAGQQVVKSGARQLLERLAK